MKRRSPGASLRQAIHIRWMVSRDLSECANIDMHGFAKPWMADDFEAALKRRNVIGLVAEYQEKVIGFMMYEIQSTRFILLRLAVHPGYRDRNIAMALLDKLLLKLHFERRDKLQAVVPDSELSIHQFLRAMGFRCVSIIPGTEGTDDRYKFEIRGAISQ